jgi:flagellar basal-body rod protein FlgC
MGPFQSLDTAASGANVARTWLDAIAHNIANLNTVNPPDQEPFRAKLVVAQARTDGTGADVIGIDQEQGDPALIFDPSNPLADADGNVHRPVVDLVTQMSDLIGAQRSYQANLSVAQSSRDAYEAAMRLGK